MRPNIVAYFLTSGVFTGQRKLWKPCCHLHKKCSWIPLKMGGAELHNINFPFLFFFLLSFFSRSPTWPLRLTTTCITQHYNSSTIHRAERKATHTCLLSCFLLHSCVFPSSLFLFSTKSQKKLTKNSEMPRNPIWTPPWRLHSHLSQAALE